MKKHLIPFIACSPFIPVSIYSQISQHPNIIMFLVDDMGWQDTSVPFYNNELTSLNPIWNEWHKWVSVLRMHMHVRFLHLRDVV